MLFKQVIWLVTWAAVVILGVDVGLLAGVVFAIITVIFRTQKPRCEVLVNIPDTDIYRAKGSCIDVSQYLNLFYTHTDTYFTNTFLLYPDRKTLYPESLFSNSMERFTMPTETSSAKNLSKHLDLIQVRAV